MGGHGWFGPRPPAGHGVHHYYFQVFALAQSLETASAQRQSSVLKRA